MAKECPACRLLNPDIAERCDCGYDFVTHRIAESYAKPNDRDVIAQRGMTVAQVGVRNIKLGLGVLAAGLVWTAVVSNNGSGRPLGGLGWAIGGIVSGASFALRGLGQYRRGKRLDSRGPFL